MTIASLDVGDKRVGIAYMVEGVIFPYKVIARVHLLKELKKLQSDKQVDTIVVGIPLGTSYKNTQKGKILELVHFLRSEFPNITFDTEDERYTTQLSSQILKEFGQDMRQKKDDLAASYILESYMSKKNKK